MIFDPVLTSIVLVAAQIGEHFTVQELLHGNVDINAVGDGSLSICMLCAATGDQVSVKMLVARPDLLINAQADGGFSALMLSARLNQPEIVQTLLTRPDLQINAANLAGNTALMLACVQGNLRVVEHFKDAPQLDVNAVNEQGATALILATVAGQQDSVNCLKEFAGIDLNAFDYSRGTALMHAVVHQHLSIVDSLKDCADINASGKAKWTALMLAADVDDPAILQSLLTVEHLELDAINLDKGKTALMIAAEKGHLLQVESLIGAGADITLSADDGRTAQQLAHAAGHLLVADRLHQALSAMAAHDGQPLWPAAHAGGVAPGSADSDAGDAYDAAAPGADSCLEPSPHAAHAAPAPEAAIELMAQNADW